ncbi:MFS transporter [Aquicella lusitana]|uniref:Putative MFS family arabinose efflux permease n=1 Tax=Aquicella lusitana TaxID=254246 RepID=A0A370GZL8_9COXI|nr:MFS transporter [Aquicella lusitana]RDI48710.1 putative MFS family arabinose efflux permease [Aquicella lusitana]VVC73913.1 Inner membrane transport protein YajR [Aquicella lusitana]
MSSGKMTAIERRAVISLSSIMGLRMIGLFMVLPVFALYAQRLPGATPLKMGLAMGIYGLFQALFQIPFGALSDRFGRKPVILLGLLIFAIGSFIAGIAHSMFFLIIGRALQGAGAVGSTILAMMADLTREESRTKSMAIAGMSIGFSFSLAMLLGPLLTKWLAVNQLFLLAVLFSLCAISVLYFSVPTPVSVRWHRDAEPELKSFFKLLVFPELAKLNGGIFILHAIFTASFVVIPINLYHFAGLPANKQWLLYLPTLLAAFIISLFCVGMAERKQQLKPYFVSGIIALAIAEIALWLTPGNRLLTALGLSLFFFGFSLLEAFLPSLISRTAPADRKGTALGIYSCSQFLGIFAGGVLGGWLYGQFGFTGVYLFCTLAALFWLILALLMQPPRFLVTHMLRLPAHRWDTIAAKLQLIPGVVEIVFVAEDSTAYLKLERGAAQHPDFIRLKEQLQSNN